MFVLDRYPANVCSSFENKKTIISKLSSNIMNLYKGSKVNVICILLSHFDEKSILKGYIEIVSVIHIM